MFNFYEYITFFKNYGKKNFFLVHNNKQKINENARNKSKLTKNHVTQNNTRIIFNNFFSVFKNI